MKHYLTHTSSHHLSACLSTIHRPMLRAPVKWECSLYSISLRSSCRPIYERHSSRFQATTRKRSSTKEDLPLLPHSAKAFSTALRNALVLMVAPDTASTSR